MESPKRRILSQAVDWPKVNNSVGDKSAVHSAPHHDIGASNVSSYVAMVCFVCLAARACSLSNTSSYGRHGENGALSE